MANSHEGVLNTAKKIVKSAAEAGADAVKFQKFFADELAQPDHEYYNLYKKLEMKNNEWKELILYAKSKKLKIFADIFGIKSAKQFLKFPIDGFKIHSADVGNLPLLKFLSKQKKPILLSVAGCLPHEIHEALNILERSPKEIILLHGFQGYPTKINDLNLNRINELKNKFGKLVGLMDHIAGDSDSALTIPVLAISKGANIIEKHFTLNRSKKGLDYFSALNPSEFQKLVSTIKQSETSFGSSSMNLSKNELDYRLIHKKNVISKKFIKKGSKLNENMFEFKRTKTKIPPISFSNFNGKIISSDMQKNEILNYDFISKKIPKVVAVIACRVGSERLFAKPLQQISGFTILHLLINQIKKSKQITDIVLAISEKSGNNIFVNFAHENNIKFVQGDDLDVLKRLIDGGDYVNSDIIFRVTSDCPFIYWEKIDFMINNHVNNNNDFSILKNTPLGAGYEIINLDALKKSHKLGSKKHRSELVSLFIYENQKKFKIQEIEPKKEFQRPDLRLTVDNPEDLLVARMIHEKIGKNDSPIELKKIIKFLDTHPEIIKINSNIVAGKAKLW